MKLYNLIIAFVCLLFIVSCGNEYDTEEYFDLEELPGYVAFDASGNDAFIDDKTVSEESASLDVFVEHPTEVTSDITVNYSISGDAVFGEDYTIAGATATGGSVIISANRGSVADTYQGAIEISTIDNIVLDGNKTIVLTLESASDSDGEIVIGRGGKDFQREVTVIIVDDECPSEYSGTYMVSTTYTMLDTNIVDTTMWEIEDYMTTITALNTEGPFTYRIEDASGGLFAPTGPYGMAVGTTGMPLDITEDCGVITFEDQMTELNRTITMGGTNSVNSDSIFTISIVTTEMINDTTSVAREIFTSTYTPTM